MRNYVKYEEVSQLGMMILFFFFFCGSAWMVGIMNETLRKLCRSLY